MPSGSSDPPCGVWARGSSDKIALLGSLPRFAHQRVTLPALGVGTPLSARVLRCLRRYAAARRSPPPARGQEFPSVRSLMSSPAVEESSAVGTAPPETVGPFGRWFSTGFSVL